VDRDDREEAGAPPAADEQRLVVERFEVLSDGGEPSDLAWIDRSRRRVATGCVRQSRSAANQVTGHMRCAADRL
jgi:hypothetical protein